MKFVCSYCELEKKRNDIRLFGSKKPETQNRYLKEGYLCDSCNRKVFHDDEQ